MTDSSGYTDSGLNPGLLGSSQAVLVSAVAVVKLAITTDGGAPQIGAHPSARLTTARFHLASMPRIKYSGMVQKVVPILT
jgi:hypothetical protein